MGLCLTLKMEESDSLQPYLVLWLHTVVALDFFWMVMPLALVKIMDNGQESLQYANVSLIKIGVDLIQMYV